MRVLMIGALPASTSTIEPADDLDVLSESNESHARPATTTRTDPPRPHRAPARLGLQDLASVLG